VAAGQFNLRERLANGGPFYFSWMTVPSPQLAGQMARLPIEGVCLDLQHGTIGLTDAAPMVAAIAAAGRPALARVLWNDPGLVGQALDMGVSAVIAPMVNSPGEAARLVRAAKYPPLGQRSWGGYAAAQAAGLDGAAYLGAANRMTLVFAMIETAEALEQVEAIAATPGLDGLFVGPSDLSIALSQGAGIDKTGSATLAAMNRIAAAAHRHGLVAGAAYRKLGYSFLAAGVDIDLLQAGAAQLAADLAGV
jgi:4-hydroxy-2-oxoheptanedioate aldolase